MEETKVTRCFMETLTDILQSSFLKKAKTNLIRLITVEEIRNTMFAIGGEKAPSLHRHTIQFFKIT